jgi:serine/threonine protein kinase/tetratricopeptide (TPR) repeat protein
MGKYMHTPWTDSQGRLLRWLPVLSALAAESARARDKTGPIDLDCGGGGVGSNMLASLTRWQRVPLSSGARLGPYEIVAPLGSGGMGVVYRAYDSRLNRIVAIKVLGPSADAAQRRQRFQREMRAIATLNHPHICALYDVGLQEDVEFFVMEYLEGETLANRLLKGPLPMADTLRHAAALADAVAFAHRHGIVHRDIKPSNIMLTASGVKLLDFGLAKLSATTNKAVVAGRSDESTQSSDITAAHTILGTLRYMAPEQLEGRDADSRTDIFALGVVLYEMATGQRAFRHHSDAGMISAILTQEPVPMVDRQPQTPRNFQFAVDVCLAKNPDDRWQSAHDLARALKWITESGPRIKPTPGLRWWQRRRRWLAAAVIAFVILAAVLTSPYLVGRAESRSLVLLPCTVIGGSDSDQAFCDGLNEAIAGKLAPLTLSNALQTTTARDAHLRGITTAVDARRQFGATLVLQGTLLREDDKVRVNYDLIDATVLRQLQGYTVSAASSDPFAIQDHLIEWAAGALALKLTDAERRTLIDHDTRNAVAREQYLQGHGYLTDSREPANVDRAIDRFTRALEIDGRYALGFAGLGRAYWQKYSLNNDPQWTAKAREACRQALEIDQHLSAAHVCLGMVSNGAGQYADAAAAYKKALESDEFSDEGLLGLGFAEEHLGDFNAAEQTYRRAVERRPHYWASRSWLANFYREQGRYKEAAEQLRQAVELTPDNASAWGSLGTTYLYMGHYTNAESAYRRSLALAPTFNAYQALGMTYYRMRRFDDATTVFEQARRLSNQYRGPGSLGRVYYWRGRKAEARALFDIAIEGLEQALRVNPNDVGAHLLLAEFHAKLGHQVEANTQLLAAGDVSSNPHNLLFGAIVHNHLGDRAAALDWLERAAKKGLPKAELRAWIELDNLRDDPRFEALLDGR